LKGYEPSKIGNIIQQNSNIILTEDGSRNSVRNSACIMYNGQYCTRPFSWYSSSHGI